MAKKKYTDKNDAATAVALRQIPAYHGTGRVTVADSWLALMKCGLYCNILVKTAQKGFPRELLNKSNFSSWEMVAYSADVKGVKVQVISEWTTQSLYIVLVIW